MRPRYSPFNLAEFCQNFGGQNFVKISRTRSSLLREIPCSSGSFITSWNDGARFSSPVPAVRRPGAPWSRILSRIFPFSRNLEAPIIGAESAGLRDVRAIAPCAAGRRNPWRSDKLLSLRDALAAFFIGEANAPRLQAQREIERPVRFWLGVFWYSPDPETGAGRQGQGRRKRKTDRQHPAVYT